MSDDSGTTEVFLVECDKCEWNNLHIPAETQEEANDYLALHNYCTDKH